MLSDPKPSNAVWTAILSSSLCLTALTGMLYLVGATTYQGRSDVLGLGYLKAPSSGEIILDGAITLNLWALLLLTAFSIATVFALEYTNPKSISRLRRIAFSWGLVLQV